MSCLPGLLPAPIFFFSRPGWPTAYDFTRSFFRVKVDFIICGAPGGSFITLPTYFLIGSFCRNSDDLTYSSEGLEHLEKALKDKSGGILLMSHIGNWEIAAHLLKRDLQDIRLLLYMGVKHKEQIEGIQKESLVQSGIRIVAVEEDGGSPMDIVEGINFIKSGGVVSLTGDVVWKRDQRTIPVMFLGHEVRLPQTPHLFALLSGAPIFIFFAFRTGKNKYHFSMSEPISLVPASRSERDAVIRHSAQRYADTIEAMVRDYPLQWYHFKSFLPSKPK